MKKKLAKIAALAMAAVSLVLVTVLVTVAFLTSKSNVITNTFTGGQVQITMDETAVDLNTGAVLNSKSNGNAYRLVPGKEYVKDPTVHVLVDSEESYVFVEISNEISGIEKGVKGLGTIAEQMAALNWKKIAKSSNGDVYVYAKGEAYATPVAKSTQVQDLPVFKKFAVKEDAVVANYANAKVVLTAYAIQADTFTADATGIAAAWEKVSAAANN